MSVVTCVVSCSLQGGGTGSLKLIRFLRLFRLFRVVKLAKVRIISVPPHACGDDCDRSFPNALRCPPMTWCTIGLRAVPVRATAPRCRLSSILSSETERSARGGTQSQFCLVQVNDLFDVLEVQFDINLNALRIVKMFITMLLTGAMVCGCAIPRLGAHGTHCSLHWDTYQVCLIRCFQDISWAACCMRPGT